MGHFVSSPREREKRDRRDSRRDKREGQGRKRNRNESEETEDPRGMNPGVYSLGISEDPPRYLSSKFDASVRSDCWDISIWKTLTQCDGNGNANANADDRGDYNSSPCTSYRRAKNVTNWKKPSSEGTTTDVPVQTPKLNVLLEPSRLFSMEWQCEAVTVAKQQQPWRPRHALYHSAVISGIAMGYARLGKMAMGSSTPKLDFTPPDMGNGRCRHRSRHGDQG